MDGHSPKLASIPASDSTVWADASPLLQAACTGLRDGELIHGDNFNLFAAMSALEIMDPKMDSGIVCTYYSIDEAIENGAAPIPISLDSTIDVQRTIDIMDHLLACEAAWHKGHSLAQTVFSCIYLLRLDRTAPHALLHSYCRVIRATCKAVVSVVSDARAHERQYLASYVPVKLHHQKEDYQKIWSHYSPTPIWKKDFAKLCCAVYAFHFFHVLACMKRPQGRGLESARKHIASCMTELESILKSADFIRSCFGESYEGDIDDKTTASGREPIGFDAMLNSRLSAPTPPRAIKILSWKKAVQYFVKLLHDLDVICSYPLDPHLESLLRFVVQFQISQPDLVARSHLQLLLVQDGKLYGRDPFFAVITKAAALPEATKNHDIQKNESILQLGMLVMNLLKILCTNAAWQRRKHGKFLQDWRVIYVQLELAFRNEFGEVSSSSNDENICMKIFQHILLWVEEKTYWIAFRFLILGFELELYSTSEYCMVYWYLYAVLTKLAEKTHLKIAVSYDIAKRKGKKKKDSPKDLARESRIPPAVLFLQCYICLAEGLTMILAALRNEISVFQSPGPFNTEQEKFVQHFELLQRACIPDHVSYPSYKESTTHACFSTLAMYNYFKDAQRIAKEVKSSFSNDPDRLAELRKLEQVAEHNSVAQNLICRLGALDPSLKVSFELSHHPFFATVVVKRS
ncbi:hypothetical protein V6N13_082238 [Hibiscus sabdariffa]